MQTARIINQLAHIRRMLDEARALEARWIVVVGHYPVVSAGIVTYTSDIKKSCVHHMIVLMLQGSNGDTVELHTYLKPLLEEYSVDAYISGQAIINYPYNLPLILR